MDWLTSIDVWFLNNAAYPSVAAILAGLFGGTVVIPEMFRLGRRLVKRLVKEGRVQLDFEEREPFIYEYTSDSQYSYRCYRLGVTNVGRLTLGKCKAQIEKAVEDATGKLIVGIPCSLKRSGTNNKAKKLDRFAKKHPTGALLVAP